MFFIPTGTVEKHARQRYPYVTIALLLINVAVFLCEMFILAIKDVSGFESFVMQYAVTPISVVDGSPFELSLLTSMFLHGSLIHIIGNMIFLLPFGDNVEDRLGHIRFLIFYILCGLGATLGYIFFNPNSATPLLGASGAIAGVLAGYLTLHFSGIVKGFFVFIIIPFRVALPAVLFIGYWFILQLFSSTASLAAPTETGGVAFLAHVFGFIAGLLLAPLFAARKTTA